MPKKLKVETRKFAVDSIKKKQHTVNDVNSIYRCI